MDEIQRLILINQLEILSALKPEDAEDNALKITALKYGFEAEIQDYVSSSVFEILPEEACGFVMDVLDMYSAIQFATQDLGEEEFRGLGGGMWSKFKGFDGNNETRLLAYSRYLIRDCRKWVELLEDAGQFNTHQRASEKYRRMLGRFNEVVEEIGSHELKLDHVRAIFAA